MGLNRYVLDHVEVANASSITASNAAVATAATSGTSTATSYRSDTATVEITTVQTGAGSDTVTYFVADVRVSDATIVRSAFANDEFGQNIIANPSEIAADVGAVLAINGDYYGFRDTGIVIRNGVAYRDVGRPPGPRLLHRRHGRDLRRDPRPMPPQLVADGVWNTCPSDRAWSRTERPARASTTSRSTPTSVTTRSRASSREPRSGWSTTNHMLFVVVDGRSTGYSRGSTMTELAQIFVDRGATVAYNLDGGGSSAMVFKGGLVNNPLGKGEERGTSDILYVAG